VIVLAATGIEAEIFAKAALVAGLDTGPALVERHGLAAVLVTDDDVVHTTSGASSFMSEPA
jgi:thiamine biosynthesis lipoprotein ApbE